MKSLQEWLDSMEKLDAEATKGKHTIREISMSGPPQALLEIGVSDGPAGGPIRSIQMPIGDANFYVKGRTELPRAVKIIKILIHDMTDTKFDGWFKEGIEKILNEERE